MSDNRNSGLSLTIARLWFNNPIIKRTPESRTIIMVGTILSVVTFPLLYALILANDGRARDLDLWSLRLGRGTAALECWSPGDDAGAEALAATPESLLLPLVVQRGGKSFPANSRSMLRKGDLVHLAVSTEQMDQAHTWLRERGWQSREAAAKSVELPEPEYAV